MNRLRGDSSPESRQSGDSGREHHSLEGVATNVKLLYKLLQDHTDKSKDGDGRRRQRIAGMLSILDDLKSRIQNSHNATGRNAELRRCNSDLKHTTSTRPAGAACSCRATPPRNMNKPPDPPTGFDEHRRLRRELANLEKMFSGLGKEKELIASELAKRVRELADAEEAIADLRAQNEKLLEKARTYRARQAGNAGVAGDVAELQERNRELSEQLMRAMEICRAMKRRHKERVEEVVVGVGEGVEMVKGLSEMVKEMEGEDMVGVKEEVSGLEALLVGLHKKGAALV